MSNEQFQMLIDLMGSAADGTYWMAVMFMSIEILEVLLLTVFGLYLIHAGYKLIHAIALNPNEKHLFEIYRELKGYGVDGSYHPIDHSAAMNKIAELKANKRT